MKLTSSVSSTVFTALNDINAIFSKKNEKTY